jgi:hypothetical protein
LKFGLRIASTLTINIDSLYLPFNMLCYSLHTASSNYITNQPRWKAETSELEAKEGHEANREALNGLPNETILAAEAAAAKVESASNKTFMISRQRAVNQNINSPLLLACTWT